MNLYTIVVSNDRAETWPGFSFSVLRSLKTFLDDELLALELDRKVLEGRQLVVGEEFNVLDGFVDVHKKIVKEDSYPPNRIQSIIVLFKVRISHPYTCEIETESKSHKPLLSDVLGTHKSLIFEIREGSRIVVQWNGIEYCIACKDGCLVWCQLDWTKPGEVNHNKPSRLTTLFRGLFKRKPKKRDTQPKNI
ncbi:MAG: hypothetical protein V4686_00615 [Patescibacteria group bacterium]